MSSSGRAWGISGWLVAAGVAALYLMGRYDITIAGPKAPVQISALVGTARAPDWMGTVPAGDDAGLALLQETLLFELDDLEAASAALSAPPADSVPSITSAKSSRFSSCKASTRASTESSAAKR